MNSIIILYSYHHKSTEKIAQIIAKVIGAEIKTPQQTDASTIANYDIVGFGSGIYYGNVGKDLLSLTDKIPQVNGKKAFIFSTSGRTEKGANFHKKLREKLESKGFTVVGEFNCAGFNTFGPFRLVGGRNKGRPNDDDLKKAEEFAQTLLK